MTRMLNRAHALLREFVMEALSRVVLPTIRTPLSALRTALVIMAALWLSLPVISRILLVIVDVNARG